MDKQLLVTNDAIIKLFYNDLSKFDTFIKSGMLTENQIMRFVQNIFNNILDNSDENTLYYLIGKGAKFDIDSIYYQIQIENLCQNVHDCANVFIIFINQLISSGQVLSVNDLKMFLLKSILNKNYNLSAYIIEQIIVINDPDTLDIFTDILLKTITKTDAVLINILVKNGADITQITLDIIFRIIINDNIDMIRLLLDYAQNGKISFSKRDVREFFIYACKCDNIGIINVLFEYGLIMSKYIRKGVEATTHKETKKYLYELLNKMTE